MDTTNVCRCCLAEGEHKDLNTPYTWLNSKEVYGNMLQECFGITMNKPQIKTNRICEFCIKLLRTCYHFKKKVIESEEILIEKLVNNENEKSIHCKEEPYEVHDGNSNDFFGDDDIETKVLEMKQELRQDSDDSDDYFLSDTARLKRKAAQTQKPVTKSLKKETKKSGKWLKNKLDNLNGDIKIGKKNKINITSEKTRNIIIKSKKGNSEINIEWCNNTARRDKEKHRQNLSTILKFSNATPFKDKTLLGYICGYCESVFPDPADLRAHTDADHKKKRLEFKSSFDMTEYSVKLDVTALICTLCDENLPDLNSLKEHLVKVHNKTMYNDIKDHILQFKLTKGDVYDCALCSSTYETFKMLKQHMNTHYSNYTCNKCSSSFATKRSLNAHKATHEEGSFKCDHCDKIFSSKAKKQYHEKQKHLGTRNISNCPYCNEPFRSYYQRNQHLIKVHNTEAQYKCNICEKTYILKSLLMYHIKKNHLMERNYQCTECGYKFFSKKALKAHMVKHTGERKYTCEVCHKAYARKYTLSEHMRIHNNDRRFKCEVCSMSFIQKCSLRSHLLSNHGISLAACDIK